jgi:hypothetical protein
MHNHKGAASIVFSQMSDLDLVVVCEQCELGSSFVTDVRPEDNAVGFSAFIVGSILLELGHSAVFEIQFHRDVGSCTRLKTRVRSRVSFR